MGSGTQQNGGQSRRYDTNLHEKKLLPVAATRLLVAHDTAEAWEMRLLSCAFALVAIFVTGALRASANPEDAAAAAIAGAASRYHLCVAAASVDRGRVRTYVAGSVPNASCDEHTPFEIGSITKVLTGFILARQLAEGAVTADEPVSRLLPGWHIPERGGRAITLLDLATHTSGLPRDSKVDDDDSARDPDATYRPADLRAELADLRLSHTPGAHYEYSNLGAGLLGYALERRTGVPLQTQIARTVLQPLGMHETVANLTGGGSTQPVQGYRDDGSRADVWHATSANLGASGYVSTLHDMTLFLRGVMSPACLRGLCTMAQRAWRDGDANATGFFWEVEDGQIWKDGLTDGYTAFVGFSRDLRCGFVILANGDRDKLDDIGYKAFIPECDRSAQ